MVCCTCCLCELEFFNFCEHVSNPRLGARCLWDLFSLIRRLAIFAPRPLQETQASLRCTLSHPHRSGRAPSCFLTEAHDKLVYLMICHYVQERIDQCRKNRSSGGRSPDFSAEIMESDDPHGDCSGRLTGSVASNCSGIICPCRYLLHRVCTCAP